VSDGELCEDRLVDWIKAAPWWSVVVVVPSKLKRSKEKDPEPQGTRKCVVEGRGLSHRWRDG
jgi:hypothetical protein